MTTANIRPIADPSLADEPIPSESPFADGVDRDARRVCVHPGFAILVTLRSDR
jgi:hypothetical protein